jgi:lysophospholipase L1-like esterase
MAYDLTLTSPTYNASGKFGSSLNGGYGTLPNILPTNGTFTVEAWVKRSATGTIQVACGASDTFWIGASATNVAVARYGNAFNEVALTSSINISDGLWHHLELDLSLAGGKLFVDGALAASSAILMSSATPSYASSIAVRAFGGNATQFSWTGEIDEVAIWSTANHSIAFAAPASAISNSATGLLALYHLDSNGTDSAGLSTTASTVTLSLSAATGVVGSAVTVTVGTNNALTGSQTESVALSSNITGTFSPTSVTLNSTTATATATFTPSVSGTATITGTATGTPTLTNGTASYSVTAGSNNALVSGTGNILFSPYNWNVGVSTAKTINPGAYFKTVFTGTTCTLQFDMTGIAAPYPQIAYQVDGTDAMTVVPIAASVTITIPSGTADYAAKGGHFLDLTIKSTTETQSRWSPQATGVSLTGIILDAGATISKPPALPLNALYYGDSITEGVRTINSTATNDTDRNDARNGWAFLTAKALGAEVGIVGFGATGFNQSGSGGVPALPTSYNLIYSGVSRVFSPQPDFVVCNMGVNDAGDITTNATTFLNGLLAATTTAKIIVLRQFKDATHTSQLQAAISASTVPSRCIFVDTAGFFNSTNSSDSLHPYGICNIKSIAPAVANAIRPIISISQGTRTARTVTLTLTDAAGVALTNIGPVKWSINDSVNPAVQSVIADSGTTTPNASTGVMSMSVLTTAASGGTVWLDITNGSGAVSTSDKFFSGPVVVV